MNYVTLYATYIYSYDLFLCSFLYFQYILRCVKYFFRAQMVVNFFTGYHRVAWMSEIMTNYWIDIHTTSLKNERRKVEQVRMFTHPFIIY